MGKSSQRRTRRKRRTDKQVQRFGVEAKRAHREQAGRTGQIKSKSPAPKHQAQGVVSSTPSQVPASIQAMCDRLGWGIFRK